MSRHSEGAAKNRHLPAAVHCTGKDQFDSKTQADQVANRTRRRKNGPRVSTYLCCTCGRWHIGNQRRPTQAMQKHRRQQQESS